MIKSEARTAIRTSTGRDNSGAVEDSHLDTWINLEYQRFRRELIEVAPTLYVSTSATQALTLVDPNFDKPADFERLIRLERLVGSKYYPVEVSDELTPHDPHDGRLNFREEGDDFVVDGPDALIPGTYRIVYHVAPTLTGDYTLEVPGGCEEIIIERVAARVRIRTLDDPAPHMQQAEMLWREQKRALRRRYGRHPVPGLRIVRGWT